MSNATDILNEERKRLNNHPVGQQTGTAKEIKPSHSELCCDDDDDDDAGE